MTEYNDAFFDSCAHNSSMSSEDILEKEKYWAEWSDALKKVADEINAQIESEKNDPPGRIRLTDDDTGAMFWCIKAKEVWYQGEKDPGIELSWGWTAGMTDEEAKETEFGGRSESRCYLNKDTAEDLYEKLGKLLGKENEAI